jgi:predicted dehydrogenase
MDTVRLGIIGVGSFGLGHVKRVLNGEIKNMVLAAVCDKKPLGDVWAKNNLPETPTFDDAETMYKSGLIDAAFIVTPHYDHPPLAMLAFEHGLHVMVEKPAGVYAKQARDMNEAADRRPDLVFGIMYNQRTNCVYRKMKEMVDGGELGRLKRMNWLITDWYRPQVYYTASDWRATWDGEGGGVLLNQCPHQLDLWQWIMGMPARISAHCHEGKWHDIETEDDVTAYAEYADGATAVFITSTGDAPGTNRLELTGDKGKLVCENDKLIFHRLSMPEPEFSKINEKHFGKPDVEVIEITTDGVNTQHNGVLQAFCDEIMRLRVKPAMTGQSLLVADGREGIKGLMISNAMHLSSWLGRMVDVPVDEGMFFGELKKRMKK